MEDKTLPFPDSGDLSRQIVSVSVGESHTVALTGDGCVYSWGRGMFGRLGTGSESDELCPVRVGFEFPGRAGIDRVKIVGVAAGAYHSLALSDDGSVWCWGYNICILHLNLTVQLSYDFVFYYMSSVLVSLCLVLYLSMRKTLDWYMDGQLGFVGENSLTPCLMDQFLKQEAFSSPQDTPGTETKSPKKVSFVKAGCMMSLAIDNVGGLWMWGNIPHEDREHEPHFSILSTSIPTPISDFYGRVVQKVACGNEHVVALVGLGETNKDNDGDLVLYSWGSNNHGQLGLGDRENCARPQIVETFNRDSSFTVYDIACGAHHTALLTYKKEMPKEASICWTFGLGVNGQLGHGNTKSSSIPEPVKELPEHAYFVSVDCGLFHTSVVSSEGYVWSWGMEKGLGLCPDASFTEPEAGDAITPRLVSAGSRFRDPIQVSCGAAHTVLVANGGYKLWSWGRGRNGVLGNGNTTDHYTPIAVLWPKEPKPAEEEAPETDKSSTEEIKLLEAKLTVMERYASILHGSVFGKPFNEEEDIPHSLRTSGYFDIGREWEQMLEAADRSQLLRLQGFYESMLDRVKDKLLQRRIQEIMKDCLKSSTPKA